jgi:hypothetical protein
MAIGKTSTLRQPSIFHGKAVRVSPEGQFVIGFSRDAEAASVIELHLASGVVEKHPVSIDKRTYKIQRIDGLPPRKGQLLLPKIWNASAKRLPWLKRFVKKTIPEPISPGRSSGR